MRLARSCQGGGGRREAEGGGGAHHVTFRRVMEIILHAMLNRIYQTGRLDRSYANETIQESMLRRIVNGSRKH